MPWHSVRPKRLSVFLAVFALLLAAMPALLASNAHAASATKAKTWNVMVGAEFIWGRRTNAADGFRVNDSRLQFSFRFNFKGVIAGTK